MFTSRCRTAGLTSTQTLTVNVTGANDAPMTTAALSAALVDTAAVDTFTAVSGSFGATDVDTGDTKTWRVNTLAGTYGTLTVHAATGAYSYAANAAAINALTAGAAERRVHVEVSDGRADLDADADGQRHRRQRRADDHGGAERGGGRHGRGGRSRR